MPQLNAYPSFNGNCAEALRFYERTLNGKLEMLTFAQTPIAGQTQADDADRRSCTLTSSSTAAMDRWPPTRQAT
jgi:uncharacterized glyoxalase superfamily protein PhnB